jgi:hypothetical protein
MKAIIKPALTAVLFSTVLAAQAQEHNYRQWEHDPFEKLMEQGRVLNPNYEQDVQSLNNDIQTRAAALKGQLFKTTSQGTIPVIFHIVLDSAKIAQMGGVAGIEARIQSQMEVLNEDYNAANGDSTNIPAAFKPLYSNLDVKFGLAHTDPDGKNTPGYHIVYTNKAGFDADNSVAGSRFACSDVKFTSTGGVESWDTKKYLNIWVTNILPMGVGGIGTPPPYTAYGGTLLLPWNEQGIVLAYFVLGRQTNPNQYFPAASATKGRALVHEAGHFLNLFHPFGMSTNDNSNCQDDDGVTDTPPQAAPTMGTCPSFPVTDVCSPATPGIIFNNHMDYANDACRYMYTTGQKDRMNVELAAGGNRYELLQHPELLQPGVTSVKDVAEKVTVDVYPNPATSNVRIRVPQGKNLKGISLHNSLGQEVIALNGFGTQQDNVMVDISTLPKGLYLVTCQYNEGRGTARLIVQ